VGGIKWEVRDLEMSLRSIWLQPAYEEARQSIWNVILAKGETFLA
jgi:hypothetical protein